jgi:hypothetical protein
MNGTSCLTSAGVSRRASIPQAVAEVHRDVLTLALQRQQRHLLVVVGREDEVRRVACGAPRVRQRALVDLDEIGPAEAGEMPHQAVADDPGTDHHALRLRWQRLARI